MVTPDRSPSRNQASLSRRAFLRIGLLAGIAAGASIIYNRTEQAGFSNWLRWALRGQTMRFANPARVGVAACSSYDFDILASLRSAWSHADVPRLADSRVVIKPNLVDFVDGHPSYTDPRFVRALIHLLRDEIGVRSIVVGEGTTFRRDVEAILIATGYSEMLASEGVDFVDLNYDDVVRVPLKGGYVHLSHLLLPRTVLDADVLISVPKLKTHHWTQVSASIKNLFGIVPGIKYGWPKNKLHVSGLNEFLSELLDSLPTRQRVAAVDGIVGMQGDGPLFGTPFPSGVVLVGTDLLAVDATCARLMGFDPSQVTHLAFSAWAGLGQLDVSKIQVEGVPLYPFTHHFAQPPAPG